MNDVLIHNNMRIFTAFFWWCWLLLYVMLPHRLAWSNKYSPSKRKKKAMRILIVSLAFTLCATVVCHIDNQKTCRVVMNEIMGSFYAMCDVNTWRQLFILSQCIAYFNAYRISEVKASTRTAKIVCVYIFYKWKDYEKRGNSARS